MVSYLQKRLMAAGKTAASSHPLSRPPEVEGDAVERALLMARLAGVPLYIVHVSTRQGIAAVAAARGRGQAAIAETCMQYLLLDEERYQGEADAAARHVLSPPLRQPRAPGRPLGGAGLGAGADDRLRPLPVQRRGQGAVRRGGFHPHSQRRGRRGVSPAPALHLRGASGKDPAAPFRRSGRDAAGEDLRTLPAQGHHPRRQRRRPGGLGPRKKMVRQRRGPSAALRPYGL